MDAPAPTASLSLIDKAKEDYRLRMEEFVSSLGATNPPTRFELNQKHQDLVNELKAANPSINSLQLEADLRDMYNQFVVGNRFQRQLSLLKSALGNSLFEETQKDLQKLAKLGSLGSMSSVDVSE